MSNEQQQLLPEHEAFNAKMESAKTEEEAAAILKDFLAANAENDGGSGELTEEQLSEVAGGKTTYYKVERQGVPVFDRLPGGILSRSPRIVTTLRKDQTIDSTKSPVYKGGSWWIEWHGAYVNMMHLWEIRGK